MTDTKDDATNNGAEHDTPNTDVIPTGQSSTPDIPLPPSGIFRVAIMAVARFGGVRRAYESYTKAIEAKNASTRALTEMQDTQLELDRSIHRLEDIKTILDTDKDHRDKSRTDADIDLTKTIIRGQREILEEQAKLAAAEREFAKTEKTAADQFYFKSRDEVSSDFVNGWHQLHHQELAPLF